MTGIEVQFTKEALVSLIISHLSRRWGKARAAVVGPAKQVVSWSNHL
jgi:hypothetical protein